PHPALPPQTTLFNRAASALWSPMSVEAPISPKFLSRQPPAARLNNVESRGEGKTAAPPRSGNCGCILFGDTHAPFIGGRPGSHSLQRITRCRLAVATDKLARRRHVGRRTESAQGRAAHGAHDC